MTNVGNVISDIVDFRYEWRFFLVSSAFSLHNILTYSAFDSLCYILCYIQQAFTFWKSSCTRIRCKIGSVCKEEPEVVLEEGVKLVQKFAIKHQNVVDCHCSDVLIANFKHISHFVSEFL